MSPNAVIDEVIASELRGRGGAFFPDRTEVVASSRSRIRTRIRTTSSSTPDESEPGSFKDNEIMARVPHRLHRGLPHRRSCGRVEERLRLHPRRVHRALRSPAFGASKELEAASRTARRRDDRAAPRRGRLHLAAKRRRCSSHSKESVVSRARSLRFRRCRGSTPHPPS